MDIATVLLLHKCSFIVGAICFCYVRWRSAEPGLEFLAAGYGLMAVASTIAGLGEQGVFALPIWKLVNFTLGLSGYGLMTVGMLQLSRRGHVRAQWLILLSALIVSAMVGWGRLYEANASRAAIFNFAATVALLVPAIEVVREFFVDGISARLGLFASLASAALFSLLVAIGMTFPHVQMIAPSYAFFLLIMCHFSITLFAIVLVQERAEARLRRFANTDALTGIPNRQHFLAALPAALRAGDAVVLLDVDHFKAINDRFGHETGDAVLIGIAQAIATVVGSGISFGRIGGEEFAVFLSDQTADTARQLAEQIRLAVKTLSFARGEAVITTSISAGVALWSGGENAASLRDQADQALYAAKRDGRDCVRVYRPSTDTNPAGDGLALMASSSNNNTAPRLRAEFRLGDVTNALRPLLLKRRA